MTTTEEVIRLAREAGFVLSDNATDESIGRFLRLIDLARAEENEACAKVCVVKAEKYYDHAKPPYVECAEAIRARRTA